MATFSVSIDGEQDLLRKLAATPRIVQQEVGRLNRQSAERGADRARQLAPVRTGALRGSIAVQGAGTSWQFGTFNYPGRPAVPLYVEYGTSRTPAHPFMTPAGEYVRSAQAQQTRDLARDLPAKVRNA